MPVNHGLWEGIVRSIPDEIRFTRDDTWIIMADEFVGRCGITVQCKERLGHIMFVDFPEINMQVRIGERIARIESDTDVFDVLSPVSGIVTGINDELAYDSGLINSDPDGRGWIFMLEANRPLEFEELLTGREYEEYLRV